MPKSASTNDVRAMPAPIVIMTSTNGGSPLTRRRTAIWKAAPASARIATAASTAGRNGTPRSVASQEIVYAPASSIAPCAKLMTPLAR